MLDVPHSAALRHDLPGLLAVWAAAAAAPLVVAASRRPSATARTLAAAIPAAVLAIVALHLLPASFSSGGLMAALALLAGFAAPALTDRLAQGRRGDGASVSSLVLVLIALTPHFVLDGLALIGHTHGAGSEHAAHGARVVAVVLHTLPLSAMLWMSATQAGRRGAGVGALAYTALATTVGFVAGDLLLADIGPGHSGLFDAFVGGTLVHVASHAHGGDRPERARVLRGAETLGVLLAVALTVAIPRALGHAHGHQGAGVATGLSVLAVLGLAVSNLRMQTRSARVTLAAGTSP